MEFVTPDIGRLFYRAVTKPRCPRLNRNAAAIPVEAVMIDRAEAPVYLRIAGKAKHLRELGMSDKATARALA